jgi:hypothetical protein
VETKNVHDSEVLDTTLNLSPEQRAEIAHGLLLSLEPEDFEQNVNQEWAGGIRRRLQAIRDGRTTR